MLDAIYDLGEVEYVYELISEAEGGDFIPGPHRQIASIHPIHENWDLDEDQEFFADEFYGEEPTEASGDYYSTYASRSSGSTS